MDALLRNHYDRIWAICRRIAGNDADAADATQEAMLTIVRRLDRFDGRSSVSTWIYRVTTNACLDELRRRGRRPRPGLPDDDHEVAMGTTPGTEAQITDRMVIDEALAHLSPDHRAAVVLRDLCDLDYATIAETLEIPPGTVRSRIARARAQLADALSGPGSEPGGEGNPAPRPGRQNHEQP